MKRREFFGVVGGAVAAGIVRLKTGEVAPLRDSVLPEAFDDSIIYFGLMNEDGVIVAESAERHAFSPTEDGVISREIVFPQAESDWGIIKSVVVYNSEHEPLVDAPLVGGAYISRGYKVTVGPIKVSLEV